MTFKDIKGLINLHHDFGSMIRVWITSVLSVVCFACAQEDISLPNQPDDNDQDAIRVKATLKPSDHTRTYYGSKEEAYVTEGTFYITYPRNTVPEETMSYTKYDMGTVVFGHPEDPETGYAYFEKDGKMKDLKWRNIKGEGASSVNLFIHNIKPENYSITNTGSDYNTQYRQKYTFKSGHPYVASPLDTIDGSNDLIICGGSSITSSGGLSAKSTTDLTFNLYHRMAMLKLNFEVYPSEDQGLVDLSRAKVYITNLYTTLSTINLYYCNWCQRTSGSKNTVNLNKLQIY